MTNGDSSREPSPIRIRLFATARVAVGTGRLDWPAPPDGIPARDLIRALTARYPDLGRIATASRYFLDGELLTRMGTRVGPGHEFAVHPPYGGG